MRYDPPGYDRLTRVRIKGMRSLADVVLPLDGLTVLIGDNGTGKSSILEALDVLAGASRPDTFVSDHLVRRHGGLAALLRVGASALELGVRLEGGGPPIEYSFTVEYRGAATIVSYERLDYWGNGDMAEPLHAIVRDASGCKVFDAKSRQLVSLSVGEGLLALQAALRQLGTIAQPAVERVVNALGSGRVHVPFHLRPSWVDGRLAPLRAPATVGVATELDRLGGNLANCFHVLSTLASPPDWQRILERVRGGLGEDVVDVKTPPAGRGDIELALHFRGIPQLIPAQALSDGQLAWLAFVALAEMTAQRSFLAFDEPEVHLHPDLLVRVVWLLEEMARSCPVVVATHSDRLLDALSDPANSVVLCELDETRSTQLLKPAPEALAQWLERYRGLGTLRAEGYGPHVINVPVEKKDG